MSNRLKKIVAGFTTLACASMMMGIVVMPAKATISDGCRADLSTCTTSELSEYIAELTATVASLQALLAGGTTPTIEGCEITSFDRNLSVAMTGDDVKCLQIILNTASDTQVADSGYGAPGEETSYFGPLTKAAVIKFQEKYTDEVLASWGLTSGTGYVGSTTRTKLNELLVGDVTPTGCDCDDWANVACGGGDCSATQMQQTRTCTPEEGAAANACDGVAVSQCVADASCAVSEGALSVALAADTPAAATVPSSNNNAAYNVPMTKVNFTAGDGDVTISKLEITRSGISQDAALDSIKLYDGAEQVGTSQSLGSDHKATFTNLSLEVEANTTKTITFKACINSTTATTYSGNIIKLGILSVDDITSNATETTGTFPLTGNGMTLTSSVDIGTAHLYNGSSGTRNSTDLTVDPTSTDVRFTQVKIMAGSAEGFIVEGITAVKNGTAAASDVTNIRLVNDTSGETLGTVDALNADGRAVFSGLNVSVTKGGYVELSIIADMNNSGSGRTITFDLHDGVSYTIDVVGATYGYGLTPTYSTFCTETTGVCQTQAINQGYLTVQLSSETPATGYIAIGASQVELAAFDFTAGGEAINITSTIIEANTTGGASGYCSKYTNVTGYDGDGSVLFGPKDYDDGDNADTLTFSDAYTIPIGTTTVHVKVNVASTVEDADSIYLTLPEGTATAVKAKGASSGKTTYTISGGDTVPPAADRTGKVQTIQGAGLKVITAGTPSAGDIVQNAQDVTFAYIDLDASASGEDVKVTQVITDDGNATIGTYYTNIINLELWGDPDTTDSVSENIKLETTTSTAAQASDGETTFTFKVPLRVKKGTTSRLTLKADVLSTATVDQYHNFYVDGDTANSGSVSATGWATGSTFTTTYSGGGQNQRVRDSGAFKIVASADMPAKAQFVAGTTGNTMMKYRMYASYEDVSVTNLYIATNDDGSTYGNSNVATDVAKIKIYYEGEQIGDTGGYSLDENGDVYITLASGEMTVPEADWVTFTIKVDLSDKIDLTDAGRLEIGLGDTDGTDAEWKDDDGTATDGDYKIVATGVDSGDTITDGNIDSLGTGAGNVVASYAHYLYDGVLVVTLNDNSPSGSASPGANKEVMRLDLEAVGDDIEINKMEFCVSGSNTGIGASATGDLTIKSSDLRTTYATLTRGDFDAYWDQVEGAADHYILAPNNATGTTCFSIGDNCATWADTYNIVDFSTTIKIEEGATKTIRVFGDTTGAGGTVNHTLQLNLEANSTSAHKATAAGIEWQNDTGTGVDTAYTKESPVSGGTLVY